MFVSVLLCLATVVLADVKCRMDMFYKKDNQGLYVPKSYDALRAQIRPDSPLVLFVRNAEAQHDNNADYDQYYNSMKQALKSGQLSTVDIGTRLKYFDPDLTEKGVNEAHEFYSEMKASGWIDFLKGGKVQYVCSPLSRSIQTALYAMPDAKIVIDEDLRERKAPFGPDLRRSYESALVIGNHKYQSLKDKFQSFWDKLTVKMAKPKSDIVYDKFGYDSESDSYLYESGIETKHDLKERIAHWLKKLYPGDGLASKTHQANVYVAFVDGKFMKALTDRFGLVSDGPGGYRTKNCDMIPVVLDYGAGPAADRH